MIDIGVSRKSLKRKKDWVGLRVQSVVELKNGWFRFPIGTFFEVNDSYGGLRLEAMPCEKCGVRMFINKVPEADVIIIGHI